MSDVSRRISNFWGVIPAGGAGTRLWPLSRASRPKFLLPIAGEASLLQQTWHRVLPHSAEDRMLVVSGPDHAMEIGRQLPDLPPDRLIVEPCPRGTAPAIGLAAALIARVDPTATMGSFASDHVVLDGNEFDAALEAAIEVAQQGFLVTIGLNPTRPETGFGYIERTETAINAFRQVWQASRFVEKPDLDTAMGYVASDRFYWNASMFVWRVDQFLVDLKRLQPDLYQAISEVAAVWGTPQQDEVFARSWLDLPTISIDEGVMELADRVAVVPAEMGWSDIGDWHSLGELLERDRQGNSGNASMEVINSTGCVVWSETDRIVALVGVRDLAVVDTPDALLVVDRQDSQAVREMVRRLAQHHPDVV